MIDKIQSNTPTGYTGGVNHIEGKSETGALKMPALDASAQVNLSGDALMLQRLFQAVKDTPDVRPEVVELIRGQLAAGAYEINAESLADKLQPLLK